MEIILAKSAGFCFGVKRAVECVYNEVEKGKIYTYGPIIHNKEVINDLKKYGADICEDLDKIKKGKVILRSHGVPENVYLQLEKKGIEYIDCTCPFVKKIHNIVKKEYNEGYNIIIVGNSSHPEVQGINDRALNSAIILNSYEEAEKAEFDKNSKYALVVQTTFQKDIFDRIINLIKDKINLKVYNTICSATSDRQNEAVDISKKVDKMIVLGDKNSANTQKLYDICKKNCKNTFLCETIYDLELNILQKNDKIGVTAGASTPPAIIKEAIRIMNANESKQSFEEMLNDSLVTLHTGDIVKGTVIGVSNGEVSVNLGYKSDGIITKSEFSEDVNIDPSEHVKPGDEIEVYVIRVNDGDGNVLCSKKRLDATKGYEEIEKAYNEKSIVKGKVTEVVKSGLIVLVNNIRAFVPSSQISNRYVEDLKSFVGQELNFNILEFDRSKRRIVVGRKDLVQKEYEEKKNKVFNSIKAGDRIEGTVSRIVDFGAFVDLGGVDGLVHISEISWGRVKKVSDVLSEGDKVTVTVLDINNEKGKISLSLKDINNDPWNKVSEKYKEGMIVDGTVVRMVPFGAFVELEEGVDGLVHISQISQKHIAKAEDVLSIGQKIKAKVTEVNLENKKISLSIKDAEGVDAAEGADSNEQ